MALELDLFETPALIEIIGCDGQLWTVSGPGMGREGVELAKNPQGLHDEAPFKQIWQQGASQDGATLLSYNIEPLDLVLAFDIVGDERAWSEIEAEFYASFDYIRPAQIRVTTDISTRTLDVVKLEKTQTKSERDPRIWGWSQMTITLRAPMPFWIGETYVSEIALSGTSQGTLYVQNPADCELWPMWTLTGPGKWTIPDMNLSAGPRRIECPALTRIQSLTINTHPREESYVASDGSNFAGRFGGVEFLYPIPPRTTQKAIAVKVEGGEANLSSCQIRMVEHWQRAYGGGA